MAKNCVVSISPVSPYQEPIPQSSGSGLNAPGGCLSKPTTSAISARAGERASRAPWRAPTPPVAQPLLDVDERHAGEAQHRDRSCRRCRPRRIRRRRSRRPPSRRRRRASARAGGDRGHLEAGHALVAAERVDADADDRDVGRAHAVLRRPERVRQRAAGAGRRDQRQLHRHPDAQPRRVGLGQPRLDAHLARRARRSRRRRARSSPAAPAYGGDLGGKHWIVQVHSVPRRASRRSLHVARRAARARALAREGDDAAAAALGADQLGRVGGPASRPSATGDEVNAASTRAGSKAIAGERATM